MSTLGSGKPTDVEFKATGLNVEGDIAAAVSIAVVYIVTWFLVLAYFNGFWCTFLFPTKVNLATLKERKERAENDLNLSKLVKLGTEPTKNVELERAPETKAAYSVLSQEQIQYRLQIERRKCMYIQVIFYYYNDGFYLYISRDRKSYREGGTEKVESIL